MPQPETSGRLQKAVLWERDGVDDYGQPTVGEGEELDVRWEFKEEDVLDPRGNPIRVDANAVVSQRIPVGSNMWLGSLNDWPGTGTPEPDDELMVVVAYQEVPDVRNRVSRRKVYLKRHRDALPTG